MQGFWQNDGDAGVSEFTGQLQSPDIGAMLNEFQLTSAIAGSSADIQFAVDALAKGLEHLSNGDLQYRISTPFVARVDRLREDFNRLFNAGAPPFDQYSDESRGLETYEGAFSRIQALWPQPRVLDLIERSIFRDLQDEETEVFDLEAYRELLLLHAMAKDMIEKQSPGDAGKSSFQHTSMEPLKAASRNAELREGRITMPMVDQTPPASPRLGLDVNLDELAVQAFEASLPDVPLADNAAARPAQDGNNGLIDFEVFDFDKAGSTHAPVSASRAVPSRTLDLDGDDKEGRPTQPPARP